jgi:uncharacterized protein (TIGR02246 family)
MTSPTTVPARDDSAVHAVLDGVSSAWADADADAFANWYAADATAVLPGFCLTGRDAIRATMSAVFAGALKGSRRIHEVQATRFVGDGTAIVISRSATAFAGQSEPPADKWDWGTWVIAEHDGRWVVEAFHGCPQNAA